MSSFLKFHYFAYLIETNHFKIFLHIVYGLRFILVHMYIHFLFIPLLVSYKKKSLLGFCLDLHLNQQINLGGSAILTTLNLSTHKHSISSICLGLWKFLLAMFVHIALHHPQSAFSLGISHLYAIRNDILKIADCLLVILRNAIDFYIDLLKLLLLVALK